MKNSLKKVDKEFEIIEFIEKAKYTINDKNGKIKIYDDDLLEDIFDFRFNQKYRKLLYLVMELSEDEDATESDIELALIKIDDFKSLIINKYFKYISKYKLDKYLKMLLILEDKLNLKKIRRGR